MDKCASEVCPVADIKDDIVAIRSEIAEMKQEQKRVIELATESRVILEKLASIQAALDRLERSNDKEHDEIFLRLRTIESGKPGDARGDIDAIVAKVCNAFLQQQKGEIEAIRGEVHGAGNRLWQIVGMVFAAVIGIAGWLFALRRVGP